MTNPSNRTIRFTVEVALKPSTDEGAREMRRARLQTILGAQRDQLVVALERNRYLVDHVVSAKYESDRSDGRGHLWGSLD